MRTEKDFLGQLDIPFNALYGIHSQRAWNNFPGSDEKHDPYFLKAYLLVKKACLRAASETGQLNKSKLPAMKKSIDFLLENPAILNENIIVSVLQGGAGTSLNMNLNEVIANQALVFMGEKPGTYSVIHPNNDVNVCQSTNDTYPTALKIALIYRIRELAEEVARLQETLQKKEKDFADIVKIGRTEFQDAIPMTLGQEFGAYAEAISRDRWRLYKAEERLRVVNLGGTAIGTSLNAPRRYAFLAVEHLRNLSGVGIAKAENLIDATANQDLFLEAFSWVKLLAVNLYKMAQDLRYLSSSPVGEIFLPALQAGSSIMPGKVNPVMPEMIIQVAMEVLSSENTLNLAVMNGNLELNAFMPLIAKEFLKSLRNLTHAVHLFNHKCLAHIKADSEKCYQNLLNSYSILTVLAPKIGYEKVNQIIKTAIEQGKTIKILIEEQGLLTSKEISDMTRQSD